MKRTQPQGDSSAEGRRKRAKTSQACVSCRKHKTRCELPSEPGISKCHRCHVLSATCSFEGSEMIFNSALTSTLTSRKGPVVDLPDADSSLDGRPIVGAPSNAETVTAEEFVVGPRKASDDEAGPGYWAEAPMGAIWDVLRKHPTDPNSAPPETFHPNDVLTVEEISYLMDLFEQHYVPWLNMPCIRSTSGAPMDLTNILVLASCAVACRHLPGGGAPRAQRGLQQLAEHAVLIRTFDPAAHASLEGVQALLILSMWSPAIGAMSSQVHDGSLIASGAVRMAMSLKLDQASQRAIKLNNEAHAQGGLSGTEKATHDDLMWKARLWLAVCNAEWLLTTGTQRKPMSVRSPCDYQLLDWRRFPGAGTALDARDFRLGIGAQVFEATQRGLGQPFKDLDSFFKELDELLTIFNHARNVTQPLRFTFPHERLHMDILYMYQQSSRLLVLFHGLASIRAWTGAHRAEKPWMLDLERSGVRFVKQWGVQILHVSQTVLELFFDILDRHQYTYSAESPGTNWVETPPSPLSSAPDCFFAAILFASSVLLVSRYTMFLQFHVRDAAFVYTADSILEQLIRALDRLARGPGHMPGKAANVVRELQRVWVDKVKSRLDMRATVPAPHGGSNYATHVPLGSEATFTSTSPSAGSSNSNGDRPIHLGAYPVSAERGSAEDRTPATSSESAGHTPSWMASDLDDTRFINWRAYQPPPLVQYPQYPPLEAELQMDPLQSLLDPAEFLDNGFWNMFMSASVPGTMPDNVPGLLHDEA